MKGILIVLVIIIILEIPILYGLGLIFKKIKLDFKKGITPFYNKYILINKYKLPQYHLILMFIPIINLYTNFMINIKLCKQFSKDSNYVLKLTFLPFIYNILFGIEVKNENNLENINNYFEDQKNIYENKNKDESETKKIKDEYVWVKKKPKKNETIYKATRNSINARVNINNQKNQEIIEKNTDETNKNKEELKVCPNCKSKIKKETEICYICGKKQ